MIVYNDIISGDEMMTDAFPQEKVLDNDGNVIEGLFGVKSSTMLKGGENVDVGCGSAFGGSEEEVLDDSVEKVNNVSNPFKYTEVPFSKKSEMLDYLKTYVRAVRAKLRESETPQTEIKEFMAQAPGMVKFLMSKFDDLQTFVGESMDSEGMMAFAYYPEGAHNPTFIYFNKGLKSEKF